jgi:hypothetical protein
MIVNFPFILRQLWRLAIFVMGVIALQALIEIFWPESGGRLAIFTALLVIYCLMAYAVIPALFRLYHFLIDHDHIPLYATYGDGWASDPVNIAIVAKDRRHLKKAMKDAGWYEADKHTLFNSLREAYSIVFNQPYPNAPISTLYLFNRAHDIAFEIPTNGRMSARTRHHVRFWKLQPPKRNRHDRGHFEFWSSKLLTWLHHEREVWIGASTEDLRPLDVRWRTGSLTHGVSHEADKERDFIIQSLKNKKLARSVHTSEPGEQFKFRGQSFRTIYTTDGSIKIVRLR